MIFSVILNLDFKKFHSTAGALLDCTNEWYINLDRKMFNLLVLIDLKKAFDTVDHQILLRALRALWNKRTSYKFAQILSYKPKTKVPNRKLFFISAPDQMWCTTRLYLRAITLFVVHQ